MKRSPVPPKITRDSALRSRRGPHHPERLPLELQLRPVWMTFHDFEAETASIEFDGAVHVIHIDANVELQWGSAVTTCWLSRGLLATPLRSSPFRSQALTAVTRGGVDCPSQFYLRAICFALGFSHARIDGRCRGRRASLVSDKSTARVVGLALLMMTAAALPGCSAMNESTSSAAVSQPAPRVENCAMVSASSPPKYACGGKVYTAFQLARLRHEQAKK
jgi:hypothetical protein